MQKDAEVLKMLEEDEDDFEEFEENGKQRLMQCMTRGLRKRSTSSSGGRTGTTKISTTSSGCSSRRSWAYSNDSSSDSAPTVPMSKQITRVG